MPTDTFPGTHVPLIANWSGTLPGGRVLDDLVDFSDFLPTLCETVGVAVPSELNIDGRSFLSQLNGQKGNPREWAYCWYLMKNTSEVQAWARTQRYKLYRTGKFFDMDKDPLEKNPLKKKPLKDLSLEAKEAHDCLKKALDQYKDARAADLSQPEQK